jgi:hypothetical protein
LNPNRGYPDAPAEWRGRVFCERRIWPNSSFRIYEDAFIKNELGLGTDLVFDFVEEHLPEDYDQVRRMFRRGGAYSRYKGLLERRGLLQKWYDFENRREEQALREWCKENDIELDD